MYRFALWVSLATACLVNGAYLILTDEPGKVLATEFAVAMVLGFVGGVAIARASEASKCFQKGAK